MTIEDRKLRGVNITAEGLWAIYVCEDRVQRRVLDEILTYYIQLISRGRLYINLKNVVGRAAFHIWNFPSPPPRAFFVQRNSSSR